MPNTLETDFHEAMLDVYRRAKTEAHYNPVRFLRMVSERGGLETARHLLHAPTVSEGYTALWERGRLDLTVEALILEPQWQPLFGKEERRIAVERLKEYEFQGRLPDLEPKEGTTAGEDS